MRVRLPEGTVRRRREKPSRAYTSIRCPSCGSHRLSPEIAFIGGAKYLCRDCGFRGAFVVRAERPRGGPP